MGIRGVPNAMFPKTRNTYTLDESGDRVCDHIIAFDLATPAVQHLSRRGSREYGGDYRNLNP